jgi:hypothetical protein
MTHKELIAMIIEANDNNDGDYIAQATIIASLSIEEGD